MVTGKPNKQPVYNMKKNKINIDNNNRAFTTFDSLIEYMTKYKYPQNIINNTILIANKPENKKHLKSIWLHDDMYVVYYKSGILKSQIYYMELML